MSTIYYSFTDYDGVTFPPRWIGLNNYKTLFTNDPQFWPAVANTVWWAVFSVPLAIFFGVILALLLNMRVHADRAVEALKTIQPPASEAEPKTTGAEVRGAEAAADLTTGAEVKAPRRRRTPSGR